MSVYEQLSLYINKPWRLDATVNPAHFNPSSVLHHRSIPVASRLSRSMEVGRQLPDKCGPALPRRRIVCCFSGREHGPQGQIPPPHFRGPYSQKNFDNHCYSSFRRKKIKNETLFRRTREAREYGARADRKFGCDKRRLKSVFLEAVIKSVAADSEQFNGLLFVDREF